jgi:hypothetical protein
MLLILIGFRYGGNGTYDITANATVILNYGCNTTDFVNFQAGNIAVIFDGTCLQYIKALNAEAVCNIKIDVCHYNVF